MVFVIVARGGHLPHNLMASFLNSSKPAAMGGISSVLNGSFTHCTNALFVQSLGCRRASESKKGGVGHLTCGNTTVGLMGKMEGGRLGFILQMTKERQKGAFPEDVNPGKGWHSRNRGTACNQQFKKLKPNPGMCDCAREREKRTAY